MDIGRIFSACKKYEVPLIPWVVIFVCISGVSLGKGHIGQDEKYTTETDTYATSADNLTKSEHLPSVIYAVGGLDGSTLKLIGGGDCVVPYGTPLKIIGLRDSSFNTEYIVDLGGGRSGTIPLIDKSFSLSAPVFAP